MLCGMLCIRRYSVYLCQQMKQKLLFICGKYQSFTKNIIVNLCKTMQYCNFLLIVFISCLFRILHLFGLSFIKPKKVFVIIFCVSSSGIKLYFQNIVFSFCTIFNAKCKTVESNCRIIARAIMEICRPNVQLFPNNRI